MSADFNERCFDQRKKRVPRSSQKPPSLEEEPATIGHPDEQDINPWLIAKLNAPRTSRITGEGEINNLPHHDYPPMTRFEPPMTPDPPILCLIRCSLPIVWPQPMREAGALLNLE